MPSYSAPVKDMMFLYEKLRDNKNYNDLERYNEVSSDLVKDILQEAAKINKEAGRKKEQGRNKCKMKFKHFEYLNCLF